MLTNIPACSNAEGYGGGKRHEMSLCGYTEWWKQHKAGLDNRLLYLKDWHFVTEFPDYQACASQQWGTAVCMPVLGNSGFLCSQREQWSNFALEKTGSAGFGRMMCQNSILAYQSCQEYLPGNHHAPCWPGSLAISRTHALRLL